MREDWDWRRLWVFYPLLFSEGVSTYIYSTYEVLPKISFGRMTPLLNIKFENLWCGKKNVPWGKR
jgi:hypothetical protein